MTRPSDRQRHAAKPLEQRNTTRRDRPTDQPERDRIESDFSTNLLVEAGAGSGKTRSLARRMAAGIASGDYVVEGMSAVTFTRKAAAELRSRFQEALEERLRLLGAPNDAASGREQLERERLDAALRGIERLFAGTIHAFCAHLLRERPVEARVSPGFVEIDEAEDARQRRQAWREFVVRERQRGSAAMQELQAVGIRPRDLDGAFAVVCQNEDVTFPSGDAPMPDVDPVWAALDTFWSRLTSLVPEPVDPRSSCKALKLAEHFGDRLQYAKRWRPDAATLAELLGDWKRSPVKAECWRASGNAAARLVEEFNANTAVPFVSAWRHHVYRAAMSVLLDARAFYAEERRRRNVVSYVDLLLVAARLLRENGAVRRALQRKYRWLFIDEFQDTDPVQAEIFLLLAAKEDAATRPTGGGAETGPPAPEPLDWSRVSLRPGALFVVGDPKQSIYRFRRADIDIYNTVRDRIVACGGQVLHLTANWRSLPGVCELANRVFPALFPASATRESPAFEALDPRRMEPDGGEGPRLARLVIPASVDKKEVHSWEAARIARFIRAEVAAGRRRYGSFLVLTRYRPRLKDYADAFDRLGIPVEVSGAGRFAGSDAVAALAALLTCLADPLDGAALVGVLRGPLFGLSDPELYEFRQAGGRFDLLASLVGADGALAEGWAERDTVDCRESRGSAHENALGQVLSALRQLRAWYRLTRRLPLGAAVGRILDQSGWLGLAAASIGGARAGGLVQAVDTVRQVVERGGGLADAAEALADPDDAANEVEVLPLEPGRRDVVRLMNLHKAKGLEAEVVFLADPMHGRPFDVNVRVIRQSGRATGFLEIARESSTSGASIALAEPVDWSAHREDERRYRDAEINRLFYVAATRARDLLVVGRWARWSKDDAWRPLGAGVDGAPELHVPDDVRPETRTEADLSAKARQASDTERSARHAAARTASWRVASVTGEHAPVPTRAARVHDALQAEPGVDDPRAAGGVSDEASAPLAAETATDRVDVGAAWGTLVHGLLEHAMRHEHANRSDLERLSLWLTVEHPELRPGIAVAIDVVQAVRAAKIWQEVRAGGEHHAEVPFAVRVDTDRPGAMAGATPSLRTTPDDAGMPTVIRGVIDLVYRDGEGWRLLDYKTDQNPGVPGELAVRHAAQIAEYRRAWAAALGTPEPRAGVFGVRALRTDWETR